MWIEIMYPQQKRVIRLASLSEPTDSTFGREISATVKSTLKLFAAEFIGMSPCRLTSRKIIVVVIKTLSNAELRMQDEGAGNTGRLIALRLKSFRQGLIIVT